MNQRTLIYIGASQLQLPAIAWAKQQGLRVVVTDSNPHTPGIALADEYREKNRTNIGHVTSVPLTSFRHAGAGQHPECR